MVRDRSQWRPRLSFKWRLVRHVDGGVRRHYEQASSTTGGDQAGLRWTGYIVLTGNGSINPTAVVGWMQALGVDFRQNHLRVGIDTTEIKNATRRSIETTDETDTIAGNDDLSSRIVWRNAALAEESSLDRSHLRFHAFTFVYGGGHVTPASTDNWTCSLHVICHVCPESPTTA